MESQSCQETEDRAGGTPGDVHDGRVLRAEVARLGIDPTAYPDEFAPLKLAANGYATKAARFEVAGSKEGCARLNANLQVG